MTDRPDTTPETEPLAAEYVLGLLTPAERVAFEARLRSEPALLAEVRRWESHFATMADLEVDPVAPPPRLRDAIEARLFGLPSASLWNRVAFWRGLSFVTSAAALAALGAVLLPNMQQGTDGPGTPGPDTQGPEAGIPAGTLLMTHLIPTEGSTLGLAVTREPSGILQVRRVAGEMAPGRAQELWVIAGDNAPVSLGVLHEDALTTLVPDAETAELFSVGAALAISDEPPGGSPTGAPTGEILALGTLVAL
ncbi:anti-sigma factor [Gymnodinialimonas ceratoperidinii]|uniref:Anti-sigma factor n=1 Tax=Gymnodinialimonas ceratoperidinii TaxID=2856823 RepID=A0A8F6U0F1_9RHOB|nr:anti-sigma factor [Gymnodinialimonas ceratoperidinii]QXT41283.1 anti-sigma factor [Gymnodinialimonas ceratoperidinii]